MIVSVVEAELAMMLAQFADCRIDDGRIALRNGILPESRIQTGIAVATAYASTTPYYRLT